MLNAPSEQQLSVIESLGSGKNVVVDSVAGSGKTTTILHIAKSMPEIKILLLTYNARLKFETREKAATLQLNNLNVFSYHAFCVGYYNPDSYTDKLMLDIIQSKKQPKRKFSFGLIILDEGQDITDVYYRLVHKIYHDNQTANGAQLCIFGDRYQSIYDFNNADSRYISHASQLFNYNARPWAEKKLSISFRLNEPTANFINNCMVKSDERRIDSIKRGAMPRYLICSVFRDTQYNSIFKEIVSLLRRGYSPDDFFILTASLKSPRSPARILDNIIKTHRPDIPIFASNNDNEVISQDLIKNKMVITTFHQSKGLERKIAIVLNFDESYFQFYKKENNPLVCPNELYVATTRASEQLILVHHNNCNYLPFIVSNVDNDVRGREIVILSRRVVMLGGHTLRIRNDIEEREVCNTSVTDLCRHLSTFTLIKAMEFIKITQVREASTSIPLVSKIQTGGDTCESVGDINGTAIPLYFEYLKRGSIGCMKILPQNDTDTYFKVSRTSASSDVDASSQIFKAMRKIDRNEFDFGQILLLANRWNSFMSGYLYKYKQIAKYDWLTIEEIEACMKNLESLDIGEEAEFEKIVSIAQKNELRIPGKTNKNVAITGAIDCIDGDIVYEFKCVAKLTDEHYLQLAIYAYILECRESQSDAVARRYYLYNILTDELQMLSFTKDQLRKMIQFIITQKYSKKILISDEEFIQQVHSMLP